jgi:hypothetical protein
MKGVLAKITSKGLSRNVQKSRFLIVNVREHATKRSALTQSLQIGLAPICRRVLGRPALRLANFPP